MRRKILGAPKLPKPETRTPERNALAQDGQEITAFKQGFWAGAISEHEHWCSYCRHHAPNKCTRMAWLALQATNEQATNQGDQK